MSEPQREDLLQQVERLEREKRRWRFLALSTSGVLVLLFCAATVFGILAQVRAIKAMREAEQARARAEDERQRALEERERAEMARQEAVQQRDQAEKARRDAEKAKEGEKEARQEVMRAIYREQISQAQRALVEADARPGAKRLEKAHKP